MKFSTILNFDLESIYVIELDSFRYIFNNKNLLNLKKFPEIKAVIKNLTTLLLHNINTSFRLRPL